MSDQIDHIAELEKRLYARDPDAVPRPKFGILRPLKQRVDSSWGSDNLPENTVVKKTNVSPFKRLFILSFIFFIVGVGIAFFSIYRGAVTLSSKNVELSILGNSFVGGGESLPVQVDIANKNASDLVDATLTLTYPRGASNLPGDLEHVKKPLDTIGSGKTKTEAFSVVLYGEQGTSHDVTATLEYKLAGSNATFVKEKTVSVMISTSPIALTVDAPTTVAANQPFTMTVRAVFTGDTILDNTVARVEFPNGFTFIGATPAPVVGNNTWDLKDMVKGTERVISIKGKLGGEEQDEKSFRVYIGKRTSDTDARIAVSYNSVLHSVVIAQPFLTSTIAIGNGTSDIVALPQGSQIAGSVLWKNTSALDITEPQFTLQLLSPDIDPDSIVAKGGYYEAVSRSIIWDAESDSVLTRLSPGDTGELPFSFSLLPSAEKGKDVDLALSVKGTFPDRDNVEDTIANIDQKTVRFATRLQFAAEALYSTGAFKNTGPFPPKADKETTYTIQWTIRPVENALTQAAFQATLPQGVVWAGVISPQGEALTYNPEQRLVTWNAGNVQRSGAAVQNRSVSFQVKMKPTKQMVGDDITLLGETTLTATDAVANVPLSATKPALTTYLITDPAYSPGKEKVLP